jgi:hypothetical protein
MHYRTVTTLVQRLQHPLHMPEAYLQFRRSFRLRDQLLLGFLQRHQPVSVGLCHQ